MSRRWLAPAGAAGDFSEGATLVGAGPRWGRSLPKLDVAGSSPVARSLEAFPRRLLGVDEGFRASDLAGSVSVR
jgi:hypothetical protein